MRNDSQIHYYILLSLYDARPGSSTLSNGSVSTNSALYFDFMNIGTEHGQIARTWSFAVNATSYESTT